MLEICFASIKDWTSEKEENCRKIIPKARQEEIFSMKREQAKRQSLIGEYLVRTMLSNRLGYPGERFVIIRQPKRKPQLLEFPVFFNISHSGDYVMAGISDLPIGVDIEQADRDASLAIRRVCSEEELVYINSGEDQEKKRQERMIEVWTRKEALVKCIGSGISDCAMKKNVGTGERIIEIKIYEDSYTGIEKTGNTENSESSKNSKKEIIKRYHLLPWEAPERYRCTVCLCLSK